MILETFKNVLFIIRFFETRVYYFFFFKGHSQNDRGTCAGLLKESGSIESSKGHSQSFEKIYPNLPHSDEESNSRLSTESCSSSESTNGLSFFNVEALSYFTT